MTDNGFASTGRDEILAEIDENHRVYLCEYNLIHLVWGKDMLPYCPGDFMGLPFMLASLIHECDTQCMDGRECNRIDENGTVYLEYGSLHFPLTPNECRQLQSMVQKAARRLHELYAVGYFAARTLRR